MTPEVLQWLSAAVAPVWASERPSVLEIGARNVNGSARDALAGVSSSWVGIDIEDGAGVDTVADIFEMDIDALRKTYSFNGRDWFSCPDAVVACECIEHMRDPIYGLAVMRRLARRWLVITSPTTGFPEHRYPRDYWRAMPDAYNDVLLDGMSIRRLDRLDCEGISAMGYLTKGVTIAAFAEHISQK